MTFVYKVLGFLLQLPANSSCLNLVSVGLDKKNEDLQKPTGMNIVSQKKP